MIQRKKQIEKLFEDLQVLKRKMIAGASSHMERTHITASQWLVLQYFLTGTEYLSIHECH